MKKRIIFAFLFTFIFTSSALAVPNLSECETLEDAYEMGYYNRLFEEYEHNTAEGKCSTSDSYMLYGIICRLYENNAFIEYSGDPEVDEYSLSEAYGDGYSTAGGDFTELYAELKHETENQTEPLPPKNTQDSYDEGYQAGYSDGKSQYEHTSDKAEESSSTPYTYFIGISIVITFSVIIYSLQQLLLRFAETHPSTFSGILLLLINIIFIFTLFPALFAEIIRIFMRWAEDRYKRRLAAEEELLHEHFLLYQDGDYLPNVWEMEEFAKRGWRRY